MSNGCPSSTFKKQPIAIVGIAADLPGGSNPQGNLDYKTFNEFLLSKGEAYGDVPKDRFVIDSWADGILSTRGSFLKHIALFDHAEFAISADDARAMGLSMRKLLELSFLSLLDAGIPYRGRNVGCFAAGTAQDAPLDPEFLDAVMRPCRQPAGVSCMISSAISAHLDLRGPSVPLDAACSSSMLALHLAVQALRAGECEAALVAGCQLNLKLADFVKFREDFFAKDGKCKPFDAAADGLAKGEGAVAIVLKPYADAVRDGDYIYGAILGTGVAASGAAALDDTLSADAQVDAMRRAYHGTTCDPRDVDFVEMHAMGRVADDLAECTWVGQQFGRDGDLLIGSVKGNIGHLHVVAFLASLCKVCSILETGVVPPNVNLIAPHPDIPWHQYKLRVPTEPTDIKERLTSGKLLISMSSNGIGGTNGHVVMQSSGRNNVDQNAAHDPCPVLLVAGGLSPRSAQAVANSLGTLTESQWEECAAISTIYGRRARQMTWRTFAVAQPSLHASLKFPSPVLTPRVTPPLVFVFSGQGPQHINMGRQLFKKFEVFRRTVLELDQTYREITGLSLIDQTGLFMDVTTEESLPSVWPIATIYPALTMLQIALCNLLRSLGLCPDIVVGHSVGETPLLYASGAGTKAMAMELAIAQGRALTLLESANGTMAALACTAAQARAVIQDVFDAVKEDGVLEIAALNSPSAVAIAGHVPLVEKAVEVASARGLFARKLQTNAAIHSSIVDVCQAKYRSLVAEVFARYPGKHEPTVTTYSATTGGIIDCFTEEYFWRNSRYPVQFATAVGAIVEAFPASSFVEVSPHPVLSVYLQELGAAPTSVVCPMRRTKEQEEYEEETRLLTALGQLVVLGHDSVEFHVLNNSQAAASHSLDLPPYPFAKEYLPYRPAHCRTLQKRGGMKRVSGIRATAPAYQGAAQVQPPSKAAPSTASTRDALRNVILQSLDTLPEDFSPDVPFTSYGMDSLAAGRLTFALRPFLVITQMQLLDNLSLADVERLVDAAKQSAAPTQAAPAGKFYKWDGMLHKEGQALIKLVDLGDTPLILLHGASGSILPFISIQEKFSTSLWALQTTPDTPTQSIKAWATFYLEQVRAAQPRGPYRIGAFCASSTIAMMMAHLIEESGDTVGELCFLDHSPLLFVSPLMEPDEETIRTRSPGPAMIRRLLDSMLGLYRADDSAVRHKAAQDWEDIANGLDGPDHVRGWYATFQSIHTGIYDFILSLMPPGEVPSVVAMREALAGWMGSINAPVTAYIGTKGYLSFIPESQRIGWETYGLHQVFPDASVITTPHNHFQILDSPEFIDSIQGKRRVS